MNPITYVNKDTSVNSLDKVHIMDDSDRNMAYISENDSKNKDGEEREMVLMEINAIVLN